MDYLGDGGRVPYESYDRCPECHGRVSSLQFDGYCPTCARRPAAPVDYEARARHFARTLLLELEHGRSTTQAYRAAVIAAHAARDLMRWREWQEKVA